MDEKEKAKRIGQIYAEFEEYRREKRRELLRVKEEIEDDLISKFKAVNKELENLEG